MPSAESQSYRIAPAQAAASTAAESLSKPNSRIFMPKIAVDAMGGDHAPAIIVEGALLAAQELNVQVVLVGEKQSVEQELSRRGHSSKLEIVPASEVVAMHEAPTAALRKKDSSMKVAFEMMKRGEVDAVVSAGNSGAMMATGMFVVGTLSQVARPAIMIVVPSLTHGTVIVDAGANVDCKPKHLVQFGFTIHEPIR